MIQNSADPLRFLNIKQKRKNNKQRFNTSIIASKVPAYEQVNQFVLPSFTSLNSLEYEHSNKIKKTYNPLKYFNPQIEDYLNKLKKVKIANSPIMPQLLKQNTIQKQIKQGAKFIEQIQTQTISMLTFSKNINIKNSIQTNNQIHHNQNKTTFNFYKPGLKKSGSMKMQQKIKQLQIQNVQCKTEDKDNININQFQYADQTQQLKQCQVCARKFNIKSYQKHIKICQKVFFNKRKPFNSRYNSLDNKNTVK